MLLRFRRLVESARRRPSRLSRWWGEELQRDAVGVSETQPRAVVGVHDAAVLDAELI